MRPLRLSASNLMQFREVDVDLSGLHEVAISGPNGAGKSSLLDAMTFALYGRCERGSADDLVRRGALNMRVRLDFALGGREFRVERHRTLGKSSSASFTMLDGSQETRLTRRTIDETNGAIVQALSLPYETFLASCMVTQGRVDEFTRLTPTRRKQVLSEVLGLELYARLEQAARERWSGAVQQRGVLRGQIDAWRPLAALLPEKRDGLLAAEAGLRESEAESARLEAEVAAAEARLQEAERRDREAELLTVELRANRDAIRREEAERKRTEDEIRDLEALIASSAELLEAVRQYDETAALAERLDVAAAVAADAVERVREDERRREREFSELAQAAEAMRGDVEASLKAKLRLNAVTVCPTCPFVADERRRAELHDYVRGEQARLDAARDEAGKAVSGAEERERAARDGYDGAAHDAARRRLRELRPMRDKAAALGATKERVEKDRRLLADFDVRIGELRAQAFVQEERTRALGDTASELRDARSDRAAKTSALMRSAAAVEARRSAAEALSGEVRQLAEVESRLATALHDQEALGVEEGTWAYLAQACGKDGIPALMIENAVPAIEAVANDVLSGLPGGMRVRLALRRMLKTEQRLADTLDVEVEGAQTGDRYEQLSGGEKDRVDLALRIGIARVAATRYGAQVRFLAVDEAFAQQDAEGLSSMIEVLAAARRYFDLVIVISHLASVRDRFPAKVIVAKTLNGSEARVVS